MQEALEEGIGALSQKKKDYGIWLRKDGVNTSCYLDKKIEAKKKPHTKYEAF